MYSRIFSFIIFLISTTVFAQLDNVELTTPPTWVEKTAIAYENEVPQDAGNTYFLLVENQHHLEKKEYYHRVAYKVLNNNAVRDMGEFSADFDPSYQNLEIHHINIIRDHKVIEKLNEKDLQVFQREQNAEINLYDGKLTVLQAIKDLRIGDIIDYSFTVIGDNPVYQDKYSFEMYSQFMFNIHQIRLRVIKPKDEYLVVDNKNKKLKYSISEDQNYEYHQWIGYNLKPINYEESTPIWYDPFPSIQLSQYKNWSEIVYQFKPLYEFNNSEKLKNLFESQTQINENDKLLLEKITNFVQDEVRYLGFEDGLNSFKPTSPIKVLEQRYGDCKDKSFLLSELYKAYGFHSSPVLVNSTSGKKLPNKLPSPDIFDHCIVQLKYKDETIYIDPTINNQGGKINNIYFPDYKKGLVLEEGESNLTSLPTSNNSSTQITEYFDLDNIGGGAYLEIISTYKGGSADNQRAILNDNSKAAIQQEFTEFYNLIYPGIQPEITFKTDDNRIENQLIIKEYYKIESIWKDEGEDITQTVPFYPSSLDSYLYPNAIKNRKSPYALAPNTNINHEIVIYTPSYWPIEPENINIDNEDYKFGYQSYFKKDAIHLNYSYQTSTDHIALKDIDTYYKDHQKMQENLRYILYYNKKIGADNALINPTDTIQKNSFWISTILFLLITILSIIGCLSINKNFDLANSTEPRFERKIGGWLILFAIILTLVTIINIFSNSNDFLIYTDNYWKFIISEENGNLYQALFSGIDFSYNWALTVFCIYITILFFKRKTIVPRLLIIMMGTNFLYYLASLLISTEIIFKNQFSAFELQEYYLSLFYKFISACIWIPYFIFSERVEETFTKPMTENSKNVINTPEFQKTNELE
ncbi:MULTISPECIES: DUF3857 domain-containing protein [Mesonia]|uniref:Uncharacterized protein n=1 Tax=Mesonia oceanica TaxID=2687242 RepID=A0AC61YE56_9FLAO|nr:MULTISPECIES: DUF3857 domain-containing protein [Mesonia]MAN27756.1 hypothetical protein [Mesonia sp.]MAQ40674.1 hypothetical protein [Mesonia sp.]MBJ96490.1 hypothetical protein [Flavobacteriaceae bacterium]VVV02360.1 hypothetical protein FVB9532_03659 [Mesonia oceanica]|tara:strand:+ start:3382 stop:5982 length:2601 start_codon:yes stop_codon:yes gene_type:complete